MPVSGLPRDDFDKHARDYAEVLDEVVSVTGAGRDYFTRNRVAWIERLEAQSGRRPCRILDLGCGDGLTEVVLQKAFPWADIVGVDVSAESVAVARERGLSRCEFAQFDGRKLPFGGAAFDLVLVAGVLHHVPDDDVRRELLCETLRVLKPGAPAYVFEHNPSNPLTRRIVDKCPFDEYARLLRSSELLELMKSAGFCRADTYFILFAPRHKLFRPMHRLEASLRRLAIGAQYFIVGDKPF